MNTEIRLNLLTEFSNHRFYIIDALDPIVDNGPIKNTHKEDESKNSKEYIESLLKHPVSKISKFSDPIWDFNRDYPDAARNVQGAKLRIDFSQYKHTTELVITEIKVILNLALINNSIFKPKANLNRRYVKTSLKANYLISIFKKGLTFVDEVFKQANKELGYQFIQQKVRSFSDITPDLYYKAAVNFGYMRNSDLDKFFMYIRSPASVEYVFNEPIPYVELNSLDWQKTHNINKRRRRQVLPDDVFEAMSKLTSFVVVDFLTAIGDEKEIADVSSLERFKASEYPSWSAQEKISRKILNEYTAMRLRTKGYSSDFVKNLIAPSYWMEKDSSDIRSGSYLRSALRDRGYKMDSLREYFNLVSYSSMYIIAQYTGMRPSELAEVRVDNCKCLVKNNDIWMIESVVKKHKDEIHTGLFDDRWVAIPIVRDSVLAASYISKIKASPYLASNVDTVSPNKSPSSMTSTSISWQVNNLIGRLLGEEKFKDVGFNPYMLRHTLAYQLYRAEVGLPLISFQLKHFVDSIAKYTSQGATSSVTLAYGDIGNMLSKGEDRKGIDKSLRKSAELEAIKTAHNPNATYYGGKADEHKNRLIKVFKGYMAEGYTEDEVYEAMADQGVAVVYMGQGLCYGGRAEDYDTSLPCIGSLRCNPARCKQAVVTIKHAPKWREVYLLNKANLNKPEYAHNREQILAAMNEAKMVLESLGEKVEI